jgi:hypothetical protein
MTDLNITLARSGVSIKIFTSKDVKSLDQRNIVLTDLGDIAIKGTTTIVKLNPMVLSDRGVVSTGTDIVYKREIVQTVVSPNGLWSLVLDGKVQEFTLNYNPLMSTTYGQYSYTTTGRAESDANLERYCKNIDNNHQLCKCSGPLCVADLGIDPKAITPAQLSILSQQCPCINSGCSDLVKRYSGRNRMIDELGPIIAGTPGTCPINAITTICTNASIVTDSTITSGKNVVTQQCGVLPVDVPPPPKDKDTDTKTDSKTDSETDSKTDSETDSKTDNETDSKTDNETDGKTDGKTDGETEKSAGAKTETTTSSRIWIIVIVSIIFLVIAGFLVYKFLI